MKCRQKLLWEKSKMGELKTSLQRTDKKKEEKKCGK